MKALHSEQYYRNIWNRMIENTHDRNYMNLEGDLEEQVAGIVANQNPEYPFREQDIAIIRKVLAEKIAKEAEAKLREVMGEVREIREGRASLGYTTHLQEISARYEFEKRFEFNCLQLADFKKKYIA